MLALIPDSILSKLVRTAALLTAVSAFCSCVTKEPAPLIADPSGKRETALPWNEQQKWEREGAASVLNQERR